MLTSGVICVASILPMGEWRVYLNWFMHDPLFAFRIIWQGGDPKAPLSSPALVKSTFFGPKMDHQIGSFWSTPSSGSSGSSVPALMEFYEEMNPEESMGWPSSMMHPFIDVEKVKRHASGNVAWIGGECDVLVSPAITRAAAKAYNTSATIIPLAGRYKFSYSILSHPIPSPISFPCLPLYPTLHSVCEIVKIW